MKCVTLGPEGTYSGLAAQEFGFEEIEYESTPMEVVREIDEGRQGVLAIENSIHGTVVSTVDLLRTEDVKIRGELVLEINHCLIGREDEGVKCIVSHPQALGQCKNFLMNNYSDADTEATGSTIKAVKLAKNQKNVFAIAPFASANKHDLDVVDSGVQDVSNNLTRFLVLGKEDREKTGCDKTSLIFYVKNEPGSLHECLGIFAENNVNLTKLESRPSREGLGDYYFYIDFEGHRNDDNVQNAILDLKDVAKKVKLLGSYPRSG